MTSHVLTDQDTAPREPTAAGPTDRPVSERQREILALAEAQGFVTIENLAQRFGVSAQTVRRDIIALDQAGLLQRFHGGAGSNERVESMRLGHAHKKELSPEAKRRIGERAAALVPDGATLFLDVGTTVEAAAEALDRRDGLRIFTNNLRAALRFDPGRHQVHVLGGMLTGRDGSLTGGGVITVLSGLNLDFALIGCSGIEPGGRVMDFDLNKIEVKKTAMRIAGSSLLLADSSKFGRSALAEIAARTAFDAVVSE